MHATIRYFLLGACLTSCSAGAAPTEAPAVEIPLPARDAGSARRPLAMATEPVDPRSEMAHVSRGISREACSAESGWSSSSSETSLELFFLNRTAGELEIYWLDFNGERVHYADLPAGEGYRQQTYVTHPWVAIDRDGVCRGLFVPISGGDQTVEIGVR